MEEKWSVTWHIFGYELGWYSKKFMFILIHILLGVIVSVPIWAIVDNLPMTARIILAVYPIFLGGCIEWTQNDKTGKKWADRKVWLLGSVRDVLTYGLFSWVVFI